MRAFVIAMPNEAEAVRPHLKAGDRLYVSGIGKVNAAAATQKAICEGADEIWNVGLCGGFGDDIEVGDVFTVDRAVEYDFDLAKLNGTRVGQLNEYDTPYLPLERISNLKSQISESGRISGSGQISEPGQISESGQDSEPGRISESGVELRGRVLATGDHFNDSEADYALITKELGASLRDMEGAAIAHVCKREGVRCHAVKCVTNVAGKGSMIGQYEENTRRCLERLSDVMKELLG